MEFVMNKGITVTIDDDEIVSWNHDQKKKACFIRVKMDLYGAICKLRENFFLWINIIKVCRVAHPR